MTFHLLSHVSLQKIKFINWTKKYFEVELEKYVLKIPYLIFMFLVGVPCDFVCLSVCLMLPKIASYLVEYFTLQTFLLRPGWRHYWSTNSWACVHWVYSIVQLGPNPVPQLLCKVAIFSYLSGTFWVRAVYLNIQILRNYYN